MNNLNKVIYEQVKLRRQDRVNQLLKEVICEVQNKNIPISNNINKEVCIDYNIFNRAGYCEWCIDGTYKIHITDRLILAQDKKIKEILAHEVLHTCPLCKNHLFIWASYANIMNNTYGYDIAEMASWERLGV